MVPRPVTNELLGVRALVRALVRGAAIMHEHLRDIFRIFDVDKSVRAQLACPDSAQASLRARTNALGVR